MTEQATPMDVYVLGLAVHPAAARITDKRLEEIVFDTTRAALDDAGVDREDLEHVTIAGSDELDGRSIASMLLAMPAGAYLKDEIKCTDSGLTGLCLGAIRMNSGFGDLGVVVSWNKNSTSDYDNVTASRAEPFYLRPIGMNDAIASGLFASVLLRDMDISEDEATANVLAYRANAARNPRAVAGGLASPRALRDGPYVAAPLRRSHQAPLTDGAAALVLATEAWLARHPGVSPYARIAGLGWSVDSYALGRTRLSALASFRTSIDAALRKGGVTLEKIDVVELDAQTGFHAAAYRRALEGLGCEPIAASGGPFAQNPVFCAGLVHAAEAILQVSGRAGPIQSPGARLALAHGCHGYAQQANVAALFAGV
jgi:acetyl-CoA acetyltransferase